MSKHRPDVRITSAAWSQGRSCALSRIRYAGTRPGMLCRAADGFVRSVPRRTFVAS